MKFKIIGEVRARFVHVVEADSEELAMTIAELDWENDRIHVQEGSYDWVSEKVEPA